MNTNTKDVETVSQRVQKTRREIEQIKAEIQKLAETGFKPPNPTFLDSFNPISLGNDNFQLEGRPKSPVNSAPKSPVNNNTHKRPATKSPVIKKNTVISKKPSEPQQNVPCNKKTKHYNVEDARDYMKKQREKRAEQLKAQTRTVDNTNDLKKEKLKELHKKSQELVQKSVQFTRERSKSRDNASAIRLDKTSPRQRSTERSNINIPKASNVRNEHRSRPRQQITNKPLQIPQSNLLKPPSVTRDNEIFEKTVYIPPKPQKPQSLLKPPSVTRDNEIFEKTVYIPPKPENESPRICDNIICDQPQIAQSEHAIMTDNCEKDTKETQTVSNKNKFEEPPWLKGSQIQSYPYNFINTVKRKLQCAVNEPKRHTQDAAVQNSVIQNLTPEPERPKSREEIKELLVKSTSRNNMKSFASHKVNLDLKNVENLELKSPVKNKTVSKSLFDNYDSESDTSKNIPEISSESLEVSKGAKLSLDNLKNLKLQPLKLNESNGSLTSIKLVSDLNTDKSYTSDFVTENDGNNSIKSSESSIYTINSAKNQSQKDNQSSFVSKFCSKKMIPEDKIVLVAPEVRSSSSSTHSLQTESYKSKSDLSVVKTVTLSKHKTASFEENTEESGSSTTIETDDSASRNVSIRNSFLVKTNNRNQNVFQSLMTDEKLTPTVTSEASKIQESAEKGASNSTDMNIQELVLKEPPLSLNVRNNFNQKGDKLKNITIRQPDKDNNSHEIHFKFEAEVRLLDDFHQNQQKLSAVEKEFEALKNKSESKILQNVDTQTSPMTKSVTSDEVSRRSRINSLVNFSRGSEIDGTFDDSWKVKEKNLFNMRSTLSLDLNSVYDKSNNDSSIEGSKLDFTLSNFENFNGNPCAGWSLNMFEQLIKDEDVRIQHLKTIIKIREQTLLDRTKSELVLLSIKRRQLLEAGRSEEASLLRKKQRGVILKVEQERNEIKKLKQMQKESSIERKNFLQRQRNLIKSGLCTQNMMSKIKVNTPRKPTRSSGPLRVVQSCSESIRSETYSRKSSGAEEILSVVSHTRSLDVESNVSAMQKDESLRKQQAPVEDLIRTLLMRESALQKRRKTTEKLMRWNQKLLAEEKKIDDLEAEAFSVIKKQQPKQFEQETHEFTGKQLNQLWRTMTGREDRKYTEDKIYKMSQVGLERFYKNATQFSSRNKKLRVDSPPSEKSVASKTVDETIKSDNYSSFFEAESGEDKRRISSISELIDNFSKIGDEISLLSKQTERDISSLDESESSVAEEVSKVSVVESMTPHQVSQDFEENLDTHKTSQVTESIKEQQEKELTIPSISIIEEHLKTVDIVTSEIQATPEIQQDSSLKTLSSDKKESEDNKESPISNDNEEILSLDEALEAASKIEESLTKLNDQLIPEEKDISENIDSKQTVPSENEITSEDVSHKSDQQSSEISLEEAESDEIISDKVSEKSVVNEECERTQKISEVISDIVSKESAVDESKTDTSITNEEDVNVISEKISAQGAKTSVSNEISSQQLTPNENTLGAELSEHLDKEKPVSETQTPDADSGENSESQESIPEEVSKASIAELEEEPTSNKSEATPKSASIESSTSTTKDNSGSKQSDLEEKTGPNRKSDSSTSISEVSSNSDGSQKTVSEEKTPVDVLETPKSVAEEKTPKKIDVKKRVSEILADANGHSNRGDKSPRLQDLYVTAYDVNATPSPDYIKSPEEVKQISSTIFGNEAEELWRKQLAIEQEIKQLEQQQKEQLPYVFVREIPNKPPPPYTPPSSLTIVHQSILPTDPKEINEITNYSSKIIYKAYQKKTLDKVKFSENSFKLCSKVELPKICGEFVFNICRDLAAEHYRQFEEVEEPSWLKLEKKPQLAVLKPLDAVGLERYLNRQLKEIFGFKKVQSNESAIIKWGRKKRDHVDEILVIESQEEESQWINFDKDELFVKDQVTNDIMKSLLDETAIVFSKILSKKKYLC